MVIKIEIDNSVEIDREKNSDLIIDNNHKIDIYNMDVTVREEAIDVKIIIIEVTVEIKADKILENTSVMTDMTVEIGIGVDQEREGNDRRHNSPNTNLGTRNRSTSRVTMNRDRVRCYRCREYDHFANKCPNAVTDDSDGYESDRSALQLITTEVEIQDNFDTTD